MPMKPDRGSPLWTDGRPLARAPRAWPRILAGLVLWLATAGAAFLIAGWVA